MRVYYPQADIRNCYIIFANYPLQPAKHLLCFTNYSLLRNHIKCESAAH